MPFVFCFNCENGVTTGGLLVPIAAVQLFSFTLDSVPVLGEAVLRSSLA